MANKPPVSNYTSVPNRSNSKVPFSSRNDFFRKTLKFNLLLKVLKNQIYNFKRNTFEYPNCRIPIWGNRHIPDKVSIIAAEFSPTSAETHHFIGQ